MTQQWILRGAALLAICCVCVAAAAGLFWSPPGEMPAATDLYGRGLYRRDTAFVAGGAQGADLLTLFVVLPAALWAVAGLRGQPRLVVLAAALGWTLYLGVSLSFGSVAFNEAFPLYVLTMPLAVLALALVLNAMGPVRPPRWLPVFLLICGLVTGLAWSLLLWMEMAAGSYPPTGYYTSRTTYALDLGLIAPGCVAAAVGLWRGRRWGMTLALPLLGVAVLLLPMMLAQTAMQLRAGVAFGPEAAAPLAGFSLVSAGAAYFLRGLMHAPRTDPVGHSGQRGGENRSQDPAPRAPRGGVAASPAEGS